MTDSQAGLPSLWNPGPGQNPRPVYHLFQAHQPVSSQGPSEQVTPPLHPLSPVNYEYHYIPKPSDASQPYEPMTTQTTATLSSRVVP